MAIEYNNYCKFANILVDDTLSKLTGVHDDFERVGWHALPSANILIGALSGINEEKEESPVFSNSSTVKFLINDFSTEIDIDYEFYVYYRVYPTYEEQLNSITSDDKGKAPLARFWKRKKVEGSVTFDKDSTSISLSDVLSKNMFEIENDSDALRRTLSTKGVSLDYLNSEEQYDKFINTQRNLKFETDYLWDCNFNFKSSKFVQNGKECVLVEISLVNKTPAPDVKLFDSALFAPSLKISLSDNIFEPFEYNYNVNGEEKEYFGELRCLNCQGDYDKDSNSILTKNYAIFEQEKITPINSLEGADISFETLSSQSGIVELENIYDLMNDFYNNSENDSRKREEFFEMKERFKENIELLKSDEKVAKAFYLMNKTFKLNSKKYDSWRLFQIVFIVSQLADIVLDKERETCELLHVMTGGGKSETYFGIIIFTAFYDRLNGKEFGVSGVTKFPLRMLSVQQLQRISNIFIFAEKIRKEEKIGGEEFSIAYFVGSQDSDFPRHNTKLLWKIRNAKEEKKNISGKIINTCPLCEGNVYLDIDTDKEVIIHKCEDCGETFKLFFSDDEIYRMLPTFIVSTVDKWAGIASNRRFRNLLGGNLGKCPAGHGFTPAYDTCEFEIVESKKCDKVGEILDVPFDTSPTLIIQDEMHLIKEGFGTIDSHFESLMETMKSEFSGGSKFKNIVMTATVAGAQTQIKHLYHKNTRIFPPSLEDSTNNTFFFEKSKDGDNPIIQRKIIGLKAGTMNYRVIFQVLRFISQFLMKIESDLENFAKENSFDLEELKEIILAYKKLLTYHNKKEAVHSVSYSIDDYVNIYKDNYHVEPEPLTGERNLDDIKEIMSKVENYYDDESNKDKLFVVNATSVVSHGVDIDDWNIMIFDGMPRNTSEYIQALSRVGRKFFGLVFVSFSSTRTRDLSFYQHFNEYHGILDDKVENVPLSRWAKLGFKQTFTSVFSAAILNYLSNELNRSIYSPSDFNLIFEDDENKVKLINFIKKAYVSESNMLGSDFFANEIEKEVNYRIEWFKNHETSEFIFTNALKESEDKYFKTQFGMRGIQDEIKLTSANYDANFRISMRRD